MTELARDRLRRGVVSAFDEAAGLGVITTDAGEFGFHCIEIVDGSRSIEVGTDVTFDVVAKLGRWEAANVRS